MEDFASWIQEAAWWEPVASAWYVWDSTRAGFVRHRVSTSLRSRSSPPTEEHRAMHARDSSSANPWLKEQ